MFDRCVCFGLLFTSDDELGRTSILPYGTIFMQLGDCFSCPLPQMYVRMNVLCRERICISSFADTSQVLIPIDGILHVQTKNKHSASSEHPIDGRENEHHIEHFHGLTSIVPQEVLHLTTQSVFSSEEFMYMSTQNGFLPATFLIETESRNT